MVEAGAAEISEDEVLEALFFAQEQLKPVLDLIIQMRDAIGVPKRPAPEAPDYGELPDKVAALAKDRILAAVRHVEKKSRNQAVTQALKAVVADLGEEAVGQEKVVAALFKDTQKKLVRKMVLDTQKRIDGRPFNHVRPISGKSAC